MKKIVMYLSAGLLLLTSCESNSVEEKIDSSDLDTALFLSQIKSIDSTMAAGMPEKKSIKRAIVLYQDFATYFPNNPKAPDYLFQVSDFYLGSGNAEKAVKVLTNIIEKYPDYKRLESVYFARASHVDFDMRDTTLAKTYYHDFLEMYPESKFAENVNSRLKTVSLSIEDLVKQFEENNAKEVAQ